MLLLLLLLLLLQLYCILSFLQARACSRSGISTVMLLILNNASTDYLTVGLRAADATMLFSAHCLKAGNDNMSGTMLPRCAYQVAAVWLS